MRKVVGAPLRPSRPLAGHIRVELVRHSSARAGACVLESAPGCVLITVIAPDFVTGRRI